MIKAKKLTKKYFEGIEQKELIVLNKLDFEVSKGKINSITGISGSGKSTFLHILGTLDKPDEGTVTFNGIDVFHLSDQQIAKFRNRNIGFVFQFHHLLQEFTAVENIAIPMMINGESYDKSIKKAKHLLEKLDMTKRSEHYPNQLSGGEQQRVAVARALINNPEIILADEPTGNLDKYHSRELLDILWQLNKDFDTTLLIVTHNTKIANKADVCYKISEGKLSKINETDNI